MNFRKLGPDEPAVERFVEELGVPYNRELADTVDAHGIADDVDFVSEQRDFWVESLNDADFEAWVAIDGATDSFADLDAINGTFAGFITTVSRPSPSVFTWPDRLVIGDFYVREPYRRGGLATELMGYAIDRARAEGQEELLLNVDVDNDRAQSFYEKLGFEPYRYTLTVPVRDVDLD